MTRATKRRLFGAVVCIVVVGALVAVLTVSCATQPRPEAAQIIPAPAATNPAAWAELYPVQYAQWYATSEERPGGLSKYKRGFDDGLTYDKLSEYPFMPVLFSGWGFGVEYNEPRGHWWMMRDQQAIDPSRVKAGGACLTCKSPSADRLYSERGKEVMSMPYLDAVELLPPGEQGLGVSCIDCHDNETLDLRSPRWTMKRALADVGLTEPNEQQRRIIVCGQCHATYSVMKEDGQSVDVNFPWQGGSWGDVSVETIIDNLRSDPARLEWTQSVTGFKLGYIRHPDVEFFTADSVHFGAGVACADCHMPYTVVNGVKTPDHNVMSPLKQGMTSCVTCHPDSLDDLKSQVFKIQDRTVSMLIDTGYSVAADAKLFELLNSSIDTQRPEVQPAYERAKAYYEQAFYRLVYMGAENSVGFHNPSEAGRILRDAMAYSKLCSGILRGILAEHDIAVPDEVDLELGKYLISRGVEKLGFVSSQLFDDPFPTHLNLWPNNMETLKAVPSSPALKSPTAAEVLQGSAAK
ncbi:MAG: ammonia-forming cytochrome c nitrite reductase subunit c552 [Actinobacteria bacterium]|nr:ammonia-forming cytochrome c nitrite reductase subunit c552 [Actinomycetota bacterium]